MPHKDIEKRRQASRDSMKRKRQGLTPGVNNEGVNIEMVPASYVQGITGIFEALPERPRYLELSDGQVLDRLNQPEAHPSGDMILRMQRANESAYNFKPRRNSKGLAEAREYLTK